MYWRWQKHLCDRVSWSESTTILLLRKRHIEYWKLMPGIALAIIYSSRRFGWSHGSSILLTHHCFKVFSCRDDKEKVLLWGGGGWYRHWNWPAKKKYKRAMWSIFSTSLLCFCSSFSYLSAAVLTLVAMTASSPQAESTVHWNDLQLNKKIFIRN